MYSAKSQVKSSHFKSQRRPHSICECIDPNVSDPCSDRRHAGNASGNESPQPLMVRHSQNTAIRRCTPFDRLLLMLYILFLYRLDLT